MKALSTYLSKADLFLVVVSFIRHRWKALLLLGLIASCGRVIQLGAFGNVSTFVFIVLEIIIELSRVLICVYVLGLASIRQGIIRAIRLFSGKSDFRSSWQAAVQKLKTHWVNILFSFGGYAVIATGLNLMVDHLAYETCLLFTLKENGILAGDSSAWTIILFFKNISVIPFTLAFESILILWATNKITLSVEPTTASRHS
jgi:hypothetical protein